MIRTRIAPAPTGHFHVGNARTALFNYLFAKKHGGAFVIRIEDTDRERSKKEFEEEILESLEWLGIAADESPIAGGRFPPYRQSERLASYGAYLEKLVSEGKAFYCFHAEAELEAEKKALMAAGENPAHRCEYRGGSRPAAPKTEPIIRFKTPADKELKFQDLIRGEIMFESDLLGDFSIARDSGSPLYNLAAVIDDHEMQISHVIRGEDHISNTPKQMLIWEALWPQDPMPHYAHLPLILGSDRAKLSSRHGATAVAEFRQAGYLAEALVNFMALLGWNPGGDREMFSMAELIENFDLAQVQKSGAVFNIEKLDWLNGGYIRRMSPEELFECATPFLPENYTLYPKPYTLAVLALEQPRLKKLSEIGERTDYFFGEPEYDKGLLRWKNMSDDEIKKALLKSEKIIFNFQFSIFSKETIEKAFLEGIEVGDKGIILWPLRVALTGRKASPGPFEIMEILGKEKSLQRIQKAIGKLREK